MVIQKLLGVKAEIRSTVRSAGRKGFSGILACCVSIFSPLVSALEVTNVGVVDDEHLVVEGRGFGERLGQVAPVLMDFAEYAYENGVLNDHHAGFSNGQEIERPNTDPKTLWVKPQVGSSLEVSAPVLERLANGRLESSEAHYLMKGANSFLGWPKAYGGFDTPVDNAQLYVSWFMKPKYDPRFYWSTTPLNQRGQFIPNEAVVINGIEGSFIGRSEIGISKDMLQFLLPGEGNANNLIGQKLVGLESGAELTFHTDFAGDSGTGYLSPGANKYIRVWEDPNGREGIRLSWTNMLIGGTVDLGPEQTRFLADVIPGQWNFMELFIDTSIGKVTARVNGIKGFEEVFGPDNEFKGEWSPTLALLGFNGKIQVHQKVEVDDIYLDYRFSRVLIGDKPNFNDLKSYKLQVPVEWSDNEILVKPGRNGTNFMEAAYLYVVNEEGQVNERGFPLCESCGSAPAAPASVEVK